MQKIAAYLLQRRDGMTTAEARVAETDKLLSVLHQWLESKGTSTPSATTGSFVSKTASAVGTFTWQSADDDGRTWSHLRLEEPAPHQHRFVTQVSVTNSGGEVAVYATLSGGSASSLVAPISIDAKCPHFVRTMLQMGGAWYHGDYAIGDGTPSAISGFEEGQALAASISSPIRTLPLLVVSHLEGQPLFPGLAQELARDLAAIARVYTVDDQASWGITEALGKGWSCYNGAIRLYWPRFSTTDSLFHHPLWTPGRLLSNDPYHDAPKRFRKFLRRMVGDVSAFSVLAPSAIPEIRSLAAKKQLLELQAKAKSAEDFRQLADMFADENEKVKAEYALLQEELVQTQLKYVSALQEAKQSDNPDSFPPVADGQEERPPKKGDVRFYKKMSSKDAYDVLVRVADCGHTSWQSAHKGDKAKKGIEKLEGTNDWKNVAHCGSCTGGGMWRVKW